MDNNEMKKNSEQKEGKKRKGRGAMLFVLVILVLIGAGVAYYFYWQGENYLTTDNVKVSAKYYQILPPAPGKLTKYTIRKGDYVKQDEIIAKIDKGGFVRSPIDGEVVQSNVTLNQMLSAGTVMAVIADTNDIYLQANIEETELLKIKEGQSVEIKLDAFGGKSFSGVVREIDKTTQTAISGNAMSYNTSGTYTKVTQLIPVKIVFTEPVVLNGLLGTNATVTIRLK